MINRIGRLTALISFLIGTTFLIAFYFDNTTEVVFFGYLFVLIAALVNIIVLALLLFKQSDNPTRKSKHRTIAIMCLNIPVVFLYFHIVLLLLNTIRLELLNATDSRLINIQLSGCESKSIVELESNESATVWISIPGDCSIEMSYLVDGQFKRETVYSYTTSLDGKKIIYRIGEDSMPVDDGF